MKWDQVFAQGIAMDEYHREFFRKYRALIQSWNGARGAITAHWLTSHSCAQVELKKPEAPEALLITCVSPTYLQGPVRWRNVHLDISEVPPGLTWYRDVSEQVLFDPIAGVTIRCLTISAEVIPIERATRGA